RAGRNSAARGLCESRRLLACLVGVRRLGKPRARDRPVDRRNRAGECCLAARAPAPAPPLRRSQARSRARPGTAHAALRSGVLAFDYGRPRPAALRAILRAGGSAARGGRDFLGARHCRAHLVFRFLVFFPHDAAAAVRAPARRPALRGPARRRSRLLCRPDRASARARRRAAQFSDKLPGSQRAHRDGVDAMATLAPAHFTESQRMELKSLVHLAAETVSYYWPMRTFVHHNPLHGLEALPFDAAVRRGERCLGGRGYLDVETFRAYFRAGRIQPRHLDAALRSRARAAHLWLGARAIGHLDVLRAWLLGAVSAPADDVLAAQLARHPDRKVIAELAAVLSNLGDARSAGATGAAAEPAARPGTLAAECDRALGTDSAERIDREMIKWCAAFLDEGHATWAMPGREKGFYAAWKFLAEREWSPCAIERSREKIARLPARAEDAVLETLLALGIDREAWQDYLAGHLAALPGWTGFIKWRADQDEYEWQNAYPIDLVQYVAVRLWYERALVEQTARKQFAGGIAALRAEVRKSAAAPAGSGAPRAAAAAWRLAALVRALDLEPALLSETQPENLRAL